MHPRAPFVTILFALLAIYACQEGPAPSSGGPRIGRVRSALDVPRVVTLEDYGATGDSCTDDHDAWNAAMTDLASENGPRALAVSPRTFCIQHGDAVPGGVRVFGFGDSSVLKTTSDSTMITIGGEGVTIADVTLQGSCVDAYGPYSNTSQVGLALGSPSSSNSGFHRFQASNVNINGFAKGTILGPTDDTEPASGPTFVGCHWSLNFAAGIEVAKQYTVFSGCSIQGNPGADASEKGLHIRAGNITWTGGILTRLHRNVWISASYNDGHGILSGALITHDVATAIHVENIANGFDFVGNSIVSLGTGIDLDNATGVRFVANRIYTASAVHASSTGTVYDSNRWAYQASFSGSETPLVSCGNVMLDGTSFTP